MNLLPNFNTFNLLNESFYPKTRFDRIDVISSFNFRGNGGYSNIYQSGVLPIFDSLFNLFLHEGSDSSTLELGKNNLIYNIKANLKDSSRLDSMVMVNHPNKIQMRTNKVDQYRKFTGYDWLPTTYFSWEEALDKHDFDKFPLVAKPSVGHSGVGIKVFKDREGFIKSKDSFDVFQRGISIDKEFRVLVSKGEIVWALERYSEKSGDKQIASKKLGESMEFTYFDIDVVLFVKKYKRDLKKIISDLVTISGFDIFMVDLAMDKENKVWVIEVNMSNLSIASLAIIQYVEVMNQLNPSYFEDNPWVMSELDIMIKKYFLNFYKLTNISQNEKANLMNKISNPLFSYFVGLDGNVNELANLFDLLNQYSNIQRG